MSKRLIQICLFFLLPSYFALSYAAPAGVQWRTYSPAIFEQARSEHKLILIFAKVSWCHWCQSMDKSSFTDPTVVQLINNRYLPVKVDIEKNSEIGVRYKIKEIPSLIILNGHDQEIKRFYGYATPQSLVRKLSGVSNY